MLAGVPGAAAGGTGMMGGINPNLLVTMMRDRANETNAANKTLIEGRNSDTQAANAQRQAFQDLENRVDHAGTPEQRANILFARVPDDPKKLAAWAASNEGRYVTGQLDSDISNVSGSSWWNPVSTEGGSAYGAGVRSLEFDEGPNDFDIGRPSAMGDKTATHWGMRRLPTPYYATGNVSKLRRLQTALLAARATQDDQ